MIHIVERFGIKARSGDIRPLGSGLINDTWLVTDESGHRYVLQRVNTSVFKDPEGLHRNIGIVTSHIRRKLQNARAEEIDRKCLRFLPDREFGKIFYMDGKDCWRVSVYIPDTDTREMLSPENARLTGLAFGEFELMLSDLEEPLVETIPDFHNLEYRLRQLEEAAEEDKAGRASGVGVLLDELRERKDRYTLPERLHREGKLPKRICHCDTKLSNILFNRDGSVACVIDLDTVMPSFVSSDYGDFLRSAANTGKEDDPDPENVGFDMEIYNAFTEGYLAGAGGFLTDLEKELLPQAPGRFAYMQAVRFLTDYLNGDIYYKISYPTHNLVRTRAQMKLLKSMEEKLSGPDGNL